METKIYQPMHHLHYYLFANSGHSWQWYFQNFAMYTPFSGLINRIENTNPWFLFGKQIRFYHECNLRWLTSKAKDPAIHCGEKSTQTLLWKQIVPLISHWAVIFLIFHCFLSPETYSDKRVGLPERWICNYKLFGILRNLRIEFIPYSLNREHCSAAKRWFYLDNQLIKA